MGFFGLFRYAEKFDYALMVGGAIAAMLVGAAMPVFALLLGNVTEDFEKGGNAMVEAAL